MRTVKHRNKRGALALAVQEEASKKKRTSRNVGSGFGPLLSFLGAFHSQANRDIPKGQHAFAFEHRVENRALLTLLDPEREIVQVER
jgi:hypothetical protein